MSDKITIPLPTEITCKIDEWLLKFPIPYNKQAAIIPALTIVQKYNNGWLTENLLDAVAAYLSIPRVKVYEVANFYNSFDLKPIGKYKIGICTNLSCMLCGCKKITEYITNKLNINFGETTKDFKFTLKSLECLSACDKAPVMLINDQHFENLTIEMVDEILSGLI